MITSRYGYGTRFTVQPGGLAVGVRQPLDMQERADDQYVTVKSGDRVDNLANTHLGSPDYWWIVADWNAIRFPLELTVGAVLRLPSKTVLASLL